MSDIEHMSQVEKEQMACVFGTLLLHDDGQELTEATLKRAISEAGISIQPYWPSLFLKSLQGKSIEEFLNVGASTPSTAGPVPGAPLPAEKRKAETKIEEEKKEEEVDYSIGGIFD